MLQLGPISGTEFDVMEPRADTAGQIEASRGSKGEDLTGTLLSHTCNQQLLIEQTALVEEDLGFGLEVSDKFFIKIIDTVLSVSQVLPSQCRNYRVSNAGNVGIPLRELLEAEATMPKDLGSDRASGVDL
jgi:hypothetical protein